jgi:hypothetical protein
MLVLRELHLPQGTVDLTLERRGGTVQVVVARRMDALHVQVDVQL